jgi:hypothetical protein
MSGDVTPLTHICLHVLHKDKFTSVF